MKRVIVTPAGRERYLSLLLKNLKRVRNEFDRWDIWVNTVNESDIEYINRISTENDFIHVHRLTVPYAQNLSIPSFFKNAMDEDSLYLRLDDDIVYIYPGSIQKMFDASESNSENFLLYGNIINNSIISNLHQRTCKLGLDMGIVGYDCQDKLGWNNPKFAEFVHRNFLDNAQKNKASNFKMSDWTLFNYERVSVNAVCWRGKDMLEVNGIITIADEEVWLSTVRPNQINKFNKIIGDAIFVHYAFHTQMEYLDTTDILEEYSNLLHASDVGIYSNLNLLKPDLMGFNRYKSEIFHNLIEKIKPNTVIEVGTWKGGSAFTMCNAIKSLGLETKMYCVDTWLGALEFFDETQGWLSTDFNKKERDLLYKNGFPNVYYQFLSNVVHTNNQDIITPIPNTSLIASRYFKNNSINADLIYIDGSHDYDDVKLDLINYYPLVSDGGILFGDDYSPAWGVFAAVNEFVRENDLQLEVFEDNFWIIKKS